MYSQFISDVQLKNLVRLFVNARNYSKNSTHFSFSFSFYRILKKSTLKKKKENLCNISKYIFYFLTE
jgi:hypothetical protein